MFLPGNFGVVGSVLSNIIYRCWLITTRLVMSTNMYVRLDRFGPSVTATAAVVFINDVAFEAAVTVSNRALLFF